MQPDNNCHIKCLIFGGHFTFQKNAFKISTVGLYAACSTLWSGYTLSTWYLDLTVYFPFSVKCYPSLSSIWVLLNGKLSMIFTSWASSKAQITWEFQVRETGSMRESTVRSRYKVTWILFVGLGRVVGSQRSFHTEIDDHDLTLLISHLLTRDLAETILLQPYDGE